MLSQGKSPTVSQNVLGQTSHLIIHLTLHLIIHLTLHLIIHLTSHLIIHLTSHLINHTLHPIRAIPLLRLICAKPYLNTIHLTL
jgi:hypothetical protein